MLNQNCIFRGTNTNASLEENIIFRPQITRPTKNLFKLKDFSYVRVCSIQIFRSKSKTSQI